jgi:hypothetical protein
MTVTTAVVVLPRRMAVWAARRALARNSLTGIELGCYLCAAVWFSAGTPMAALGGGAALGAGYLARRIGGQLTVASPGGRPPGAPRSPLRVEAYAGGAYAGWYIGWLAVSCALAGELAVYAGLAVGVAGDPVIAWKLATGAAMLLALRKVVRLCRAAAVPGPGRAAAQSAGSARPPSQDQTAAAAAAGESPRLTAGTLISRVLAVPAWARALVITGTAAYYGNRIALLAVLGCGAVGLAWSLVAGPHRPGAADGDPGPDRAPSAGGVAACRDDGPIARFAGAVVHGQLVPLPPAVAGLIATVLLATLGLGSLDGLVLLTPVAAMLLAAPGSAHPHDGRLDWLAPVIIQAGQYVYLGALGFAVGIPGPVTFGLIGLVALRQLDVAYQARRPVAPGGPKGSLGWEGRMLVAGFSAMVGLGAVGYLALIGYLGWLLCCSGLSGWFFAYRRAVPGPAARDLAVRN